MKTKEKVVKEIQTKEIDGTLALSAPQSYATYLVYESLNNLGITKITPKEAE